MEIVTFHSWSFLENSGSLFFTIIIRQSPSLPRSNEEERQDGSYSMEHQPGGQSPYLLEHLESISRARLENLKISISGKLWLTAVDSQGEMSLNTSRTFFHNQLVLFFSLSAGSVMASQ